MALPLWPGFGSGASGDNDPAPVNPAPVQPPVGFSSAGFVPAGATAATAKPSLRRRAGDSAAINPLTYDQDRDGPIMPMPAPAPGPAPAATPDPAPAVPAAPSTPSAVVTNPPAAPSAFRAAPASTPAAPAGAVLLPLDESEPDDEPTGATSAKAPAAALPGLPAAPVAPGLPGVDDASGEAGNQQALRDERATNKFLRSQGAQLTVTPTGQTQPMTDAQGNNVYRQRVNDPFVVGDDGEAYRVSTNAAGNQQYFRILDGVAGQDFHEDPNSGEQYVVTSGADGASKRHVLGVNPWIGLGNTLRDQASGLADARDAAQIERDQAEQGTGGAPSLRALRQQASQYAQLVAPAQRTMGAYQDYLQANPDAVLSSDQLAEYHAAQTTVQQHAPAYQQVQGEVERRQAVMDNADQRHTQARADAQAAGNLVTLAHTPAFRERAQRDLAALGNGGDVDPAWTGRYQRMGLVDQGGNLTEAAAPFLLRQSPQDSGQVWQDQQKAVVSEFPEVNRQGSPASQTFARAFALAGNDPRKALAVARAVLGNR